ncbi:MAG: hypothetical protein K0R31_57 [Clostridiales bacterium]|jgi:YhcH/YjgK/YiaL family protein|nr:hypothetical protein [Clostridiales bacterium]
MILDNLNNWDKQKNAFGKAIKRGIEYLIQNDFSKMGIGQYEVDSEGMVAYVKENKTLNKSELRPEAHQKYIDIQFVYSGEEKMGYAPLLPDFEVDEDTLDEKDTIFYRNVKNEVDLIITQGMYAIFFPGDVHRANCLIDISRPVKKVLIKIPVNAL